MSAAVAATILAAAAPAAAGPFLGLGLGTVPTLRDEGQGLTADSRSGRLELGHRFLNLVAVEGAVGGFQLADRAGAEYDAITFSGGGRVFLPLSGPLALFGRAGVEHTWVRAQTMDDYRGNGTYVGLGAELRLALPLGETSVWVDYSLHRATLDNGAAELDAGSRMWTAGLSVGI